MRINTKRLSATMNQRKLTTFFKSNESVDHGNSSGDASETTSTSVQSKSKPSWISQFGWLRYHDGQMHCLTCEKFNPSSKSAFIKGTKNFQRSALIRHQESDDHTIACQSKKQKSYMDAARQCATNQYEPILEAQLRTALWLADNVPVEDHFFCSSGYLPVIYLRLVLDVIYLSPLLVDDFLPALLNWIQEETGAATLQDVSDLYDILLSKYITISNRNLRYECSQLTIKRRKPNHCLIQPGLFKGTYGSHGIELVNLSYSDSGNTAIVKKISCAHQDFETSHSLSPSDCLPFMLINGDSNVPYQKDSFHANLKHPLILTAEEQETVLSLMNATSVTKVPIDQLPSQPFVVPRDCVERMSLPKTCKARFRSSGQVAGIGYLNPSFTDGHWIIFNEDLFGYLWLELLLLSAFERVEDRCDNRNLTEYSAYEVIDAAK
ncbi:F-box only protein 31 [Nymphon striatum]|nr:F-box only protein 31 [Nymphon striatum]